MKKEYGKSGGSKYIIALKSLILGVLITAIFISLFAVVMYLTETGVMYATVFATVSLAAGTLAAAFYAAKKIGNRGFLIGLIVGGITFALVTVISLIVDKGGLTYNTLFHFIIIMLSALIGGVLGVNKGNNRKYI